MEMRVDAPCLMKVRTFPYLMITAAMVAVPALARSEEAPDANTPAAAESAAAQPEKNTMPETPADVAAAPADAAKTESGLASKILQAGTGDKKPTAADTVTVHYSGWTTDGKMFDSSVKRGEPTSFPLGGVIAGWTEGVQLMVVGEKRRFWIPEDLAYGPVVAGSGRPGGMLCFDVELLEIKEAPKPPEDTEKTESGVAYKITKEGEGDKPGASDVVTFHFTAATMEGQTVQDSRSEPAPPSVPLDKLPPALGELFADMKPGELRKSWLPEPQVPGGFIVADLELISFKAAPPAPPVPEDVSAAPDDAEKTESGIAHKVLAEGKGEEHPKATDTVKVHYSGWTTDGKMFDSSVTRGDAAQFPLSGVIKGWTEGVQLMVVGEKRRFWIPADLAYGPAVPGSGRPGGMLVFDIELLEIAK
ncbi:FKBP-type peptidyl-prolyl cis-trans isomerase [Luteolibacter sp. AS25]|uniref:FKBP-type peptidyl-prolyl cis-trans isomerase n=1 Tax=Luteolibacter sp. AS25 TaxID=3135776 RepID=UPI00398A9219